jgi:hypothetical protein
MFNKREIAHDVEGEQLLARMKAAKESGNGQEVNDCLAEAKRRLSNNYLGDNPIRDAQSRLLRAFPPEDP